MGEATACYEQMSPVPEQQAGGTPWGRRDVVRDPPLQPSLGSLSEHSTSAPLSSPRSATPLLPHFLATVQLGN